VESDVPIMHHPTDNPGSPEPGAFEGRRDGRSVGEFDEQAVDVTGVPGRGDRDQVGRGGTPVGRDGALARRDGTPVKTGEPSATQQLWILDMYGFVLAGLLITMGALGDRIGRRVLVLGGGVLFGAASVVAAYAHSAGLLIAARALLGLGGAALMPSTLALIRNLFRDEKQRGRAVGLWTAVMTTGISLGPVVSGLLLEHFWWGSVFLINLPAMVLLLVLVPFLVPEFRSSQPGRFDLPSAALSLAALLPVVHGIKELARHGYEPMPVLGIAVGLLLGLVFVRRQKRLAHPMVDLALLGRRAFGGPVLADLLAMFATVGMAVFLTQYLQSVLGMSPLEGALWSMVPAVGVAVTAPAAAALAQRVDRACVMGAGFLVSACGFLWLTRCAPTRPSGSLSSAPRSTRAAWSPPCPWPTNSPSAPPRRSARVPPRPS
jgi:MFS transporter, DHA2 family, multidrug resistance protein